MIGQDLRNRYTFMREHAGGIVGENARCALELARADQALDAAVDAGIARVDWEYEEGWASGDLGDAFTEDEMRAKFESNEWTGPYWCAIRLDIETTPYTAAGLGMIVLGSRDLGDPYARVVAAELASEIIGELRASVARSTRLALERIHALLNGAEWSADTLAEVAEILVAAGFEIRDPAELDDGQDAPPSSTMTTSYERCAR